MKDKKTFASGICFDKLFWLFMIGSVIGTIHEQLWHLVKKLILTGEISWEARTALIYGPFNIIYGIGAVILVLILGRKRRSAIKTFSLGALLGGAYEYIMSYLQELIFGTISWDYSEYFLNINGRTTIPYMCFWGFLTVLLIKYLYPFLSKQIEKVPYKIGKIATYISLVLMLVNAFLSISAITRQQLRQEGVKPYTFIGEFCDKYYTDDFLKKVYPNMKTKK